MSKLKVAFVRNWIDEQREKGCRVIRSLEQWIKSLEWVSLKSSSNFELTVELQPAEREKFLNELAGKLTADFGEAEPWAHATFSGDISGLAVPVASKEPEPAPVAKVEDSLKAEKKSTNEPSPKKDPAEVVEEICSRVPVKHSRELEVYVRETAEVIPMLQKMGAESSLWHQHLLLAVDAGYGRSEFLSDLAQLYKTFGLVTGDINPKSVREFILLPPGREREDDGYRVNWDTVLAAAQDMEHFNTRNGISRVVLYIDISAWLPLLATVEGKNRLRRLNSLCGTFLIVFRVPSIEGHILREAADALNDILNVRTITVPPAPVDAMIDYACGELSASGFQIAETALAPFEQLLLREKVLGKPSFEGNLCVKINSFVRKVN